jgi:hypothetical protein
MQLRSFGTMWQTRRQLTIPARNGRQTIGSVRAKLRGATTAFAKALAFTKPLPRITKTYHL